MCTLNIISFLSLDEHFDCGCVLRALLKLLFQALLGIVAGIARNECTVQLWVSTTSGIYFPSGKPGEFILMHF